MSIQTLPNLSLFYLVSSYMGISMLQPLHLYVAFQAAQMDKVDELCKEDAHRNKAKIPFQYTENFPHDIDPKRKCYLCKLSCPIRQDNCILYGRHHQPNSLFSAWSIVCPIKLVLHGVASRNWNPNKRESKK